METITAFLPIIVMVGLVYFMLIRPQKKQADAKKQMIDRLSKGDQVVTIGGLHGVIDEVDRENNTAVLDCEGVYLTFAIHAIASVIPTKPVESAPITGDDDDTAEA